MQKDDQKEFLQLQESKENQQNLIHSEVYERCLQFNHFILQPAPQSQEIFNRFNISYCPNSPYEVFHFEVQQPYRSFPHYYIVHVKLACFSLTVTAIKCQNSIPLINGVRRKQQENIYSLSLYRQEICIKKIRFTKNESFQQIFARTVKEWSILKICSALKCGPFTTNYFGFDLVIHDDCIEFACEKCQHIAKLTDDQERQLKDMLSIMHGFKIIHLDVKPDNIMFSNYFAKPVFIDFGFSQIIKQEYGYKTLTPFKGTPYFCSPEMQAIMAESASFIDLYYNDAYGLDITVKDLKQPNHRQNQQEIRCQYESEQWQVLKSKQKCEQYYRFIAFQYFYLSKNQENARRTLSDLLDMNDQIISEILVFIKNVIKDAHIPPIFTHDLQAYRNREEYKEIQNILKFQVERIYIKQLQQEEFDKQGSIAKIEPTSFGGSSKPTNPFSDLYSLVKMLTKLDQFSDKTIQPLLSSVFQHVRFDKRNNDLADKVVLCQKAIVLLTKYMRKQDKPIMIKETNWQETDIQTKGSEIVRQFISLLLYYCLTVSHSSQWVKDRLFKVAEQAIILKIDLTDIIDRLFQIVSKNFESIYQQVIAIFEYMKLTQTFKLIRQVPIRRKSAVQNKIFQHIQSLTSKLVQITQKSIKNQEVVSTVNILKMLNLVKQPFQSLEKLEYFLSKVKDPKIISFVYYYITDKKITLAIRSVDSKIIQKLISELKSIQLRKKLDFFSFVLLVSRIITFTGAQHDLIAHSRYVGSVINCHKSNQLLYYIQIQDVFYWSTNPLFTLIKQFREQYKTYESQKYMISCIQAILSNFSMGVVAINQANMQKLQSLYYVYKQFSPERYNEEDEIALQQSFYTIYRIKIQSRYYRGFDLKQLFLKNLHQSKTDFQQYSQSFPNQGLKYNLLYFRYTAYQSEWLFTNEQYDQCTALYLQLIIFFLKSHMLFYLFDIFIKLRVAVRDYCQHQKQRVIQACVHIYNYLKEKNIFSFLIFSAKNISFANELMSELGPHKESILHQILLNLAQCVYETQLQNYAFNFFYLWGNYLDQFPHHRQTFRFQRICNSEINLKINPYLLVFYVQSLTEEENQQQLKLFKIIAANCDRLGYFGKNKIMERYFKMFISSFGKTPERRRHFIFRCGKYMYAKDYLLKSLKRVKNKIKKECMRPKLNKIIMSL